jgi:hypothetical protein
MKFKHTNNKSIIRGLELTFEVKRNTKIYWEITQRASHAQLK